MKKRKAKKSQVVFSTGEESLSTLGDELRRKYPEMADKFQKLQVSDQATGRLVDTLGDLFPYDWKDAESFVRGARHCIRGNYLGALGEFSEMLESEPEAYPALHLLGYVCGSMGKYKMEADYYRKAIKIKPDYPQVYLDLGITCSMLGKEARAYEAFKQAVTLAPDFDIADHWLTFASDNLGRYIDPDGLGEKEQGEKVRVLTGAYYMLGRAFLEYGLNAVARTAFKNAIRLSPKFAPAHYELGALHVKKLRNPSRRQKYLDTAESLFTENGDRQHAQLCHQLNYREQVKDRNSAAEDWFNEGLRLHQLGLYQGAVDAYKAAIAFRAAFPDAYYNMGIAYGSMQDAGMDKIESAIGAFKHTLRLKEDFIHAHIALGAAYIRQGKYQDAVKLLIPVSEMDPDNHQVHYYLGTALRSVRKVEAAAAAFGRSAELAPDSLQVRFSHGMALVDAGHPEAAADAFQEAVRIRPDFADAHYMLGSLYHSSLEDPERAGLHLKKAEKLYLKLKDQPRVERVRQLLEHQLA